ncbi:holin family 6 [Pseudomonas phage PSA6]|uniref:Holin family 6 n=1 Tax=Pseudomonas phage PSA6 TaxID=3038281 RepID=A0AAF0GFM2_9CAUD|nr:holin family 6 [Pseudomonas phage PSA6]
MEIGEGAVRAAPIVGAIGADVVVRVQGLTLNDLFYITTITYTLVQLILVVWKTIREERRKDKEGGPHG